MDRKKNNKGRPSIYTDAELKSILEKYVQDNPGKLTYLQLEKATKIKRHVWSRRMAHVINRLNQPIISQSLDTTNHSLPLPNIHEYITRFEKNKKGLRDALFHLNEVIQSLYEQNLKLNKKVNDKENLEEIIKQKEKEIKEQQAIIKHYESLVIASSNPSVRREKGIRDNVISINEQNKQQSLSLDFKSSFATLFDD